MKTNKGFGVLAALIIVAGFLIVGGGAYYIGINNSPAPAPNPTPSENKGEEPVKESAKEKVSNTNCVVVNFPKENDKVTNIVKVSGYVNGCDNWLGDIGVAGEMYIKDEKGNFLNDGDNAMDGNLDVVNWGSWDRKYPVNFNGQIVIVKQPETKFGILTINNVNQSENNSIDRKKEIRLDLSNVKVATQATEVFKNQPGAIKSVTASGSNNWVLAVDLLSPNPKWIPGVDSTGGFFINQNSKIRNLNVTSTTKAYDCGMQYGNDTSVPPSLQNISSFISNIKNIVSKAKTDPRSVGEFGHTAYFDISGTNITAIYTQCLP
jgi:hypothetical protein